MKRILILGGGFAGVSVARELAKQLRKRRMLAPAVDAATAARNGRRSPDTVEVRLADRHNYSVFDPFLPEILSATIEPTHAVVPLRRMLPGVGVEVGAVERIDTAAKRVYLRRPFDGKPFELEYDVLVIALGGVTNFQDTPGMAEHALTMKTLGDAFYLRNRALDMLEAARVEPDDETRRELLTFVVVGGGSTGVETAAQLQDLVVAAAATFKSESLKPRIVLVHGRSFVLQELGDKLGRYTTRLLMKAGIELILGRHVSEVDEHGVALDDGQHISARTVVSTVGNAPNPVLADLPTRRDAKGWIKPDSTFALPDLPDVWALGDAASIPDAKTGKPLPATAQHAIREGPHLARNIVRVLEGEAPEPFHYATMGQLVSLGRRKAAGVVLGIRVSGFVAWFIWRSYYLLRLPTIERRIRVALDWTADLILPRDVVEMHVRRTPNLERLGLRRDAAAGAPRSEDQVDRGDELLV